MPAQTKKFRTPPEQAREWRCSVERVISLIKSGELKAFTLSPPTCTRPRWRIPLEAAEEFERTHGVQQPPKSARKRRSAKKDQAFVEYV